jgi:hypothetical protein
MPVTFVLPRTHILCTRRESFKIVLFSIHDAGWLHGDLRLPNLSLDVESDPHVLDLSHACRVGQCEKAEKLKMAEFDAFEELLETV